MQGLEGSRLEDAVKPEIHLQVSYHHMWVLNPADKNQVNSSIKRFSNSYGDLANIISNRSGARDKSAQFGDLGAEPICVGIQDTTEEKFIPNRDDFESYFFPQSFTALLVPS